MTFGVHLGINLDLPTQAHHNHPPTPTMSAAAEGSGPTTKATTTTDTSPTLKDQQKPAAALEEDDEFEDFPVDGMFISFDCSFLKPAVATRKERENWTWNGNNWADWVVVTGRLAIGGERSAAGAGGRDDASVGGELGRR